jgi:putative ABC transport system substrate-binding protein
MKHPLLALLVSFVLALLAAPVPSPGQQPGKVYRIGYLSGSISNPSSQSFLQGLRDLGYVDGRNVVVEYRWAEGRFERLPDLAAGLVRLQVDVIVAEYTQASLAAKGATSTIPVIMVGVVDPVGVGLVASLARPGGNITGTSSMAAEIVGKQLALLKETVPNASRVAVLWNPANQALTLQVKEAEAAARALAVQLLFLGARNPDELDGAFSAMTRERVGAVQVLADLTFYPPLIRRWIADLAARSRLPAVYAARDFADAGGLMAYGPSYTDIPRRTALYVDISKYVGLVKSSRVPA